MKYRRKNSLASNHTSKPAYGLCAGFLVPHPPVLVPAVGKGKEKQAAATLSAYKAVGAALNDLKPDTVVLLSPHAPMFSDYIFMYNDSVLKGDLRRFQADCRLSFPQDNALAKEIERLMANAHLPGGRLDPAVMRRNRLENTLDHGAFVPLYYLSSVYHAFHLVAMAPSALDLQLLFLLGRVIREAAERLQRRIVIVASGDLSHKANKESPYGTCPEGAEFDQQLVNKLKEGDLAGLFTISPQLREKAAECGYRPLIVLSGAFDGLPVRTQVLSYEAPFGIGYCVAQLLPKPPADDQTKESAHTLERLQTEMAEQKKTNSLYVQLARQTLEEYVQNGRIKPLEKDAWLREKLQRNNEDTTESDLEAKNQGQTLWTERAGVFVSLKKFGELRGCIGTTAPTTACLAEEIRQNAISAGTRDPRFAPVTADELPFLEYSVDVLGKPEPVQSKAELDPQKYGVIVSKGARRGLLLPDLEGIDSVEDQLAIACRKAGIDPQDTYEIARFTVTRYH